VWSYGPKKSISWMRGEKTQKSEGEEEPAERHRYESFGSWQEGGGAQAAVSRRCLEAKFFERTR